MRSHPLRLITFAATLTLLGVLLAAAPEPHPQSVRVVVLGSSTAEGVGPSVLDSAWVNRYQRHLMRTDASYEVFNLARGGYTTYHLLPSGHAVPAERPQPDPLRNITQALRLDPEAIVINLPSNDAAAGYSVGEQLDNYDAILAAAGEVPVWITTTQPRNLSPEGRQNLLAMRDSTFVQFGDRALDFWSGLAREDGTIDPRFDSGDGIHLNGRGHRVLFERVAAAEVAETVAAGASEH